MIVTLQTQRFPPWGDSPHGTGQREPRRTAPLARYAPPFHPRLADLLIEVENDLRFSAHCLRPGEKRTEPAFGDGRIDAIGTKDVRS